MTFKGVVSLFVNGTAPNISYFWSGFMADNRLLCAKVTRTHGVRGEVKLIMFADGPEFFDGLKRLYSKDGTAYDILSLHEHKGMLIASFEGIDTIEKAEKIKNTELYADRGDLKPLPDGRYYIADIIGLKVITDEGRFLGEIVDVLKTGSNDVYTVKAESGKEHLIPVTDEVVLDIDIEKGEVLVHLLKGLIDDED
jgi:16S rRNA processing protein RimM